MRSRLGLLSMLALACAGQSLLPAPAKAQQNPNGITTVFYILLENRCFTSGTDTSYTNVLYNNKNGGSPYLTALATPGSTAYTVSYQGQTISQTSQCSFCSAYHNDFGSADGTSTTPYYIENQPANPTGSVHPSEPNYIFMEAGSNLSITNDNDPYGSSGSVPAITTFLNNNPSFTGESLSELLQNAGISWTSYTEGTGLLNTAGNDFNSAGGTLTNNISPIGKRTVPTTSFSGTSASYTNAYNGSHQYNFATKHTGQLFFPATNGGTTSAANTSTSNSEVSHYAPLEQLDADLAANTQAQYCVITPDQYNDGHTALSSTFTYSNYGGTNSGVTKTYTGGSDLARVAQMDSFCAIMVPKLMNSPVYQAGHAAIVIWTDETEGSPQNDFYHTLTEMVISPFAKGNGYNSTINLTHSSDLATMQRIFGVAAKTPTGYLNDAANPSNATPAGTTVTVNTGQGLQTATGLPFFGFGTGTAQDMSDLFQSNVIPTTIPALSFTASGFTLNRRTGLYAQTVTVTNQAPTAISGPIYMVAYKLSGGTLSNSAGNTTSYYAGSPYIQVTSSGLAAGASTTATLQFSSNSVSDALEVVATGSGTP
ncbi:MAG: alkaline phosphatase family protein [Chthoniobacteraceae bacterium]